MFVVLSLMATAQPAVFNVWPETFWISKYSLLDDDGIPTATSVTNNVRVGTSDAPVHDASSNPAAVHVVPNEPLSGTCHLTLAPALTSSSVLACAMMP